MSTIRHITFCSIQHRHSIALNYHNIQSISHLYVLFFVNRPALSQYHFYFININEKCIIIYIRNIIKKCNNARQFFFVRSVLTIVNCAIFMRFQTTWYIIFHFGANFWRHFHIETFECYQEAAYTYSPKIANSCVSVTGFFFALKKKQQPHKCR